MFSRVVLVLIHVLDLFYYDNYYTLIQQYDKCIYLIGFDNRCGISKS